MTDDDAEIRYGLFDRILAEEGGQPSVLADRLGWPRSRVSNWRTRVSPPKLSSLREMCERTGRRLVLDVIPADAARVTVLEPAEQQVIDLLRQLRAVSQDEYERLSELLPTDIRTVIDFAKRRSGAEVSRARSGSDR